MRAKITTRLVRQVAPQAMVYEIWDTELPGFVLRVWPSGQASYYLVYRTRDSRKVRYRIGPMRAMTVAQARDLAQQYAARTVAGEDIQATLCWPATPAGRHANRTQYDPLQSAPHPAHSPDRARERSGHSQ